MIFHKDQVISEDIQFVCFACDVSQCKGACCEAGDAGAPLEDEEISILEDLLDKIKPFMTADGIAEIEKNGVFDVDITGEFVTPLVDHKQCAFVYYENSIAFCAIEKAYIEKKINFIKPISCHLYPIRINNLESFEGIVYHPWDICQHALTKGKNENIPLYKFLKEPLIRRYGQEWYDALAGRFDNSSK